MTISVRLNEDESDLFKRYAKLNNISVSDMIRSAVLEKIEDEYDLECYENAMAEHNANPVTYTLDEVKKELGL